MLRLLPTVAYFFFFANMFFLSADLVGNRTYSLRTHALTRGDYHGAYAAEFEPFSRLAPRFTSFIPDVQ